MFLYSSVPTLTHPSVTLPQMVLKTNRRCNLCGTLWLLLYFLHCPPHWLCSCFLLISLFQCPVLGTQYTVTQKNFQSCDAPLAFWNGGVHQNGLLVVLLMCFSWVPGPTLLWNGHSAFIGDILLSPDKNVFCARISRMTVGDCTLHSSVSWKLLRILWMLRIWVLHLCSIFSTQYYIIIIFFLFGKVLRKAISIIHFYHAVLLKQTIMRKKCSPQSGLKLISLIKTITLTYHLWS